MSINSVKEFKFGFGRAKVVLMGALPLILGAVFVASEISNGGTRAAVAVAIVCMLVATAFMVFYAPSPDKVTVDVGARRLVICSCRGLKRSVRCFDVSQMKHLGLRRSYSRSASEVVLVFSYGPEMRSERFAFPMKARGFWSVSSNVVPIPVARMYVTLRRLHEDSLPQQGT